MVLLALALATSGCRPEGVILSPSVGMDSDHDVASADANAASGSASQNASTSALPAKSATASKASDETKDKAAPEKVDAPPVNVGAGDADAIPWTTGEDVGFGVATKDTGNPRGNNIFVGCAGYGSTLEAAEAWVSALYKDSLRDRGVRRLYAIQGPADVLYSQFEIGNSRVASSLAAQTTPSTNFILVVAHSSGTYVAHEMLNQLATGLDPDGRTTNKIVYFDLDGGDLGLSQPAVERMRRAYFVVAFDPTTNTYSPNQDSMVSGASTWPEKGGYYQESMSNTGCAPGATWCLHMALITTQPHDPAKADVINDYSDFSGRSVAHGYIDEKAADAGLGP